MMSGTGIGVNLRVTAQSAQGGRKYMEDMFSVAYQQSPESRELEYAYFGIFDGHGGVEAAIYAKQHLIDAIISQSGFWSNDDRDVLRAIRNGYIKAHLAMYKEHEKWPKTASGLPSTSGTTATVAFIRKGKVYIGHVGDSCMVLGYQDKDEPLWKARTLTTDHKPECRIEMNRIRQCGGKVVSKSGVPRVVWNRPRLGHKGPIRRSTTIDEIPFLAVARALGDFWSYNSEYNKFVVSPEPEVNVFQINVEKDRCLILGTDGLWNMLSPATAVSIVQASENHNEQHCVNVPGRMFMQYGGDWVNPSKSLVDRALRQWAFIKQRADNTSVVTLLFYPPGRPKKPPQNIQNFMHFNEQPQLNSIGSRVDYRHCRLPVCKVDSDISPLALSDTGPRVSEFARYPVSTSACVSQSVISTSIIRQYASNEEFDNFCSTSTYSTPTPVSNTTSGSVGITDTNREDHKLNRFNCPHEQNAIQINEVSSSGADILETESTTPSSFVQTSIKRKHSSSHSNQECDNRFTKIKQKRLVESSDGNSDIENHDHWLRSSWSEPVTSNNNCANNNRKSVGCKQKISESITPINRAVNRRSVGYKQKKIILDQKISTLKPTPLEKSDKNQTMEPKTPELKSTRKLRSGTFASMRTLRSRNINLEDLNNSKSKTESFKSSNESLTSNVSRLSIRTTPCSLTKLPGANASSSSIVTRSSSKKSLK